MNKSSDIERLLSDFCQKNRCTTRATSSLSTNRQSLRPRPPLSPMLAEIRESYDKEIELTAPSLRASIGEPDVLWMPEVADFPRESASFDLRVPSARSPTMAASNIIRKIKGIRIEPFGRHNNFNTMKKSFKHHIVE